jgi:hypothetical protein
MSGRIANIRQRLAALLLPLRAARYRFFGADDAAERSLKWGKWGFWALEWKMPP